MEPPQYISWFKTTLGQFYGIRRNFYCLRNSQPNWVSYNCWVEILYHQYPFFETAVFLFSECFKMINCNLILNLSDLLFVSIPRITSLSVILYKNYFLYSYYIVCSFGKGRIQSIFVGGFTREMHLICIYIYIFHSSSIIEPNTILWNFTEFMELILLLLQ